jgi:DNA-binding SARP family transcriptional activator
MTGFGVLGPLSVRHNETSVTVRAPALRRLLAVLLCRTGRPAPVSELAHVLWNGEPSPHASRTLQVYVHRLRKLLRDGDQLVNSPAGYQILVEREELDALHFADLVDQGRAARGRRDLDRARTLFVRALRLWRGPPYADVDLGGPIAEESRRLEEQRLLTHQECLEVELDLGHHDWAVPDLTGLVNAHPYRERLRALQMLALYRAGRRAEALEVFRATHAMLTDRLGVEPSELMQHMHVAMLHGDRRLASVRTGELEQTWGPVARATR